MDLVKARLILCLILLLPLGGLTQNAYRVLNWNVEKGLTQSTVYCILEDKNGFIWFTSEDGLNRFDGNYFRTFQSSFDGNNQNIIGVEMIGLVEDSLHNIWVGSDEGLNHFDINTEVFTHLINKNISANTLSNFIIPFFCNKTEVWCLEMSGDIIAYNVTTFKRRKLFSPGWWVNYKSILEAKWDEDAKVLWVPSDKGLIKISLSGEQEFFFSSHAVHATHANVNVYCLQLDYQRNCLWVGTSAGLFKKSFLSDVFERVTIPGYAAELTIAEVSIDKQHRLWIGTEDKGIIIWSPGMPPERIVRNAISNTGLSSNNASNIYFDRKGIVWVSNGYKGVDQLFQSQFNITSYTQTSLLNKTLNSCIVRTISKWPDGRVAAGTEDSGIILLDPTTNAIEYLDTYNTSGLISDYIGFIKKIPDTQQVFIGSSEGMQFFDVKKKKFKNLHFKLTNKQKTDSVYVKHCEVWGDKWIIGTQNEGAFQFTMGQDTAFQIGGTEGRHVHYIGKVKEGALLVYWDMHSDIYIFDRNTWHKSEITLDKFSLLYCYYNVNDNTYWFATSKGLKHVNSHFKTIKDYTTLKGLPNNFIYTIVPDNEGFLWLSTNKGISRFDPKREVFYNLSTADGLQGFEYNSKACLLDSNVLYFGGMNGFDKITSMRVDDPEVFPSVYLKGIDVNGEKFTHQNIKVSPSTFSYNQNNFSFSIGIIDFFNTSNTSVKYKLEGADNTWNISQLGSLKINYASLSPGRYTLKLQSYNRLVNTRETVKDFSFIILPPFWLTWWFLLVSGCIIGIALYILLLNRWNQKLKILQIRDSLSRDLHDDIGGTLSSIRIYTEMLHQRPDEKSFLDLIQKNVLIMLDKLEVITWASNPRNDLFKNLIKDMEQVIIPLFHANKIEYTFNTYHISPNKIISGQIRQHLFLLFKESINNIVKHAACSKVDIVISKNSKEFILQIQDNGKGFDINKLSRGNGLRNMEYRARKLNGQLYTSSKENAGTIITLKMHYPFR